MSPVARDDLGHGAIRLFAHPWAIRLDPTAPPLLTLAKRDANPQGTYTTPLSTPIALHSAAAEATLRALVAVAEAALAELAAHRQAAA